MTQLVSKLWVLFVFSAFNLNAVIAFGQTEAEAGLMIEHQTEKELSVNVQIKQPMKVWTADKQKTRGYLQAVTDSSFVIDSVETLIASTVKIKAYSKELGSKKVKKAAKITAWIALGAFVVFVVGLLLVLAMGFTGIAAIFVAWGGSLAGLSLLFLLGALVALIGGNVPASTFKLGEIWKLKPGKKGK